MINVLEENKKKDKKSKKSSKTEKHFKSDESDESIQEKKKKRKSFLFKNGGRKRSKSTFDGPESGHSKYLDDSPPPKPKLEKKHNKDSESSTPFDESVSSSDIEKRVHREK